MENNCRHSSDQPDGIRCASTVFQALWATHWCTVLYLCYTVHIRRCNVKSYWNAQGHNSTPEQSLESLNLPLISVLKKSNCPHAKFETMMWPASDPVQGIVFLFCCSGNYYPLFYINMKFNKSQQAFLEHRICHITISNKYSLVALCVNPHTTAMLKVILI